MENAAKADHKRDVPIPVAMNIGLTILAGSIAIAMLWVASHVDNWWWIIAAAIVFSFINNTIFSLLHESVHGIFHSNRKINDAFGMLTAAFFPTGFTFQKICHLGHHRRNRTDDELFDYIQPGENKLMKFIQWYGILTGVYWTLAPLGCLLYLMLPGVLQSWILRGSDSKMAQQTSADAMLSGFDNAPATRIRLEILFSILFQAGIIYLFNLSFFGWMICYAAFAINWSSLQYADHAWTDRHVLDGAWNLRVNKLVKALFLNYHHHKAHHQYPRVPWRHLDKFVDFNEERPAFWRIYLSMWKGPQPLPEDKQEVRR